MRVHGPDASSRSGGESADRIQAVRRFNRYYTQRIGVLAGSLLGSEFSLGEARVLYEIAHHDNPTAADLARELDLDQGYLSKILRDFERRGFLRRTQSASDSRKRHLELTEAGITALEPLDRSARQQVSAMLAPIPESAQVRLLDAMHTIESVLEARPGPLEAYTIRPHGPGDLGWIVQRHAALHTRERGWDARTEAAVARDVAKFAHAHDPAREHCWIVDRRGERIGSVLLVARSRTVAELRLLLVEPSARRQGIGARLVDECVRFARRVGYARVVAASEGASDAAARFCGAAGFRLCGQRRRPRAGASIVMRTWELKL